MATACSVREILERDMPIEKDGMPHSYDSDN